MRVYYDPVTFAVTNTYDGPDEYVPKSGVWIEVPAQDFGELVGLTVVGNAVVRSDLAPIKANATQKINDLAGAKRRTFITALPGQEMLYLKKEAEAASYVALSPEPSDLTDFPLMAAEVGAGLTAPTAYQLAQIWLYMGHEWKIAAGQIETARLGAVYAIEGTATEAAIDAVLTAYRAVMQ